MQVSDIKTLLDARQYEIEQRRKILIESYGYTSEPRTGRLVKPSQEFAGGEIYTYPPFTHSRVQDKNGQDRWERRLIWKRRILHSRMVWGTEVIEIKR